MYKNLYRGFMKRPALLLMRIFRIFKDHIEPENGELLALLDLNVKQDFFLDFVSRFFMLIFSKNI